MTEKTDTINPLELGYVKTGVKVTFLHQFLCFRKKLHFHQF